MNWLIELTERSQLFKKMDSKFTWLRVLAKEKVFLEISSKDSIDENGMQ